MSDEVFYSKSPDQSFPPLDLPDFIAPLPVAPPTPTAPYNPTWYIDQAISPTASDAEQEAVTANPVVFVDKPTESLASLIKSAIPVGLVALGWTAFTIWLIWLCIHISEIGNPAIILVLLFDVAVNGLLIWGAVDCVQDIITNVPKYIAIGSKGIEIWQRNNYANLPWSDIQIGAVRVRCTISSYRRTGTTITTPRIRLALTHDRLRTLPRSHHCLFMRATWPYKDSAPFNALITLFSLKNRKPEEAASAFIADIALSRFIPAGYEPIEVDPLPVILR